MQILVVGGQHHPLCLTVACPQLATLHHVRACQEHCLKMSGDTCQSGGPTAMHADNRSWVLAPSTLALGELNSTASAHGCSRRRDGEMRVHVGHSGSRGTQDTARVVDSR